MSIKKLKLEVTKFTIVGAANFLLTFIIFFLLTKIVELNYLVSLVTASVIGVVFTYTFNYIWVFQSKEKLRFKSRFIKYLFANFLSILLNVIALKAIVENTGFDPFYCQMALIPFIIIINFSTAKFWSLRSRNLS